MGQHPFPSHQAGSTLYEQGTPNSPAGTGLPPSPAPGVGPSVVSAFNPNVTFQFQPYSTAAGGLSNNDLQLNTGTVTSTLTLTNPGQFSQLALMQATGNGPGDFAMQLNFKDAPSLMVPAIASPDWANPTASVFNSTLGFASGLTTFNGTANRQLTETDYSVPVAYQGATLTSITFDWLSGGQVNIMGISGDAGDEFQLQCIDGHGRFHDRRHRHECFRSGGPTEHRQQHLARDGRQHRRQCWLHP